MRPLHYREARELVIDKVRAARHLPPNELVDLENAAGRVLADEVRADRDYPPFDRATRDGYAVRAADVAAAPATLRLLGEVRAGSIFAGSVGQDQCVSIMTGAPAPPGADAVVMIEHTRVESGSVIVERPVKAGANIVPRGSEAAWGAPVLSPGKRIGYPEIAMLATVGCRSVPVYRRPAVAILPTGDEVVEIDHPPLSFQIRNSNSYSLRVQVAAAGGFPGPLGIAPDEPGRLGCLVEEGLAYDLLLLSGGVSVGKYDLVEQVLRELGAEFYFDAVAIQPGRPLVFGRARDRFFFGLPGNPLSTMVTFELFARPAVELLAGAEPAPLAFQRARLEKPVRHKTGRTRFLPAVLSAEAGGSRPEPTVRLTRWRGSGDIASLTGANCYLVVPEDREELPEGEWVSVLPL